MDNKLTNNSNILAKKSSTVKENNILFFTVIILGIIFDILFKGEIKFSIAVTIFIILFYVIFYINFNDTLPDKIGFGLFLLLPILLNAASFMIFYNYYLLFFNLFILPFLIYSQTLIVTKKATFNWYKFYFILDIIHSFFVRTLCNLDKWFIHFSAIFKKEKPKSNNIIKKVFFGILISIPIILLLISLMSIADSIFNKLFEDTIKNLNIDFGNIIYRIFLFAVFVIITFAYLLSLKSDMHKLKKDDFNEINIKFDVIIVSTTLVLVNAILSIFTLVQFKYLFSGGKLPEGFSYAEYARKGFFELVFISVIIIFILMMSINIKRIENSIGKIIYSIVQSILVINVYVILYSAFKRMNLYEAQFGYTILRVFTELIMLFLAILFLLGFVRIWKENLNLTKAYIVVSILAISLLPYTNMDVYITKKNIKLYKETNKIDILYLTSLSDEVIPELLNLGELNDPQDNKKLNQYLSKKREFYKKEKNSILDFNFAHQKIKNSLDNIKSRDLEFH